jgi:hypothetical protein
MDTFVKCQMAQWLYYTQEEALISKHLNALLKSPVEWSPDLRERLILPQNSPPSSRFTGKNTQLVPESPFAKPPLS